MNAIWLVLLQKMWMGEKAYMRKQIDVSRAGGGISRRNCGVSEMCLEAQRDVRQLKSI
jgi:hypothetical protein